MEWYCDVCEKPICYDCVLNEDYLSYCAKCYIDYWYSDHYVFRIIELEMLPEVLWYIVLDYYFCKVCRCSICQCGIDVDYRTFVRNMPVVPKIYRKRFKKRRHLRSRSPKKRRSSRSRYSKGRRKFRKKRRS